MEREIERIERRFGVARGHPIARGARSSIGCAPRHEQGGWLDRCGSDRSRIRTSHGRCEQERHARANGFCQAATTMESNVHRGSQEGLSLAGSTHRRRITISGRVWIDRKSTRLNSSHLGISYAVFCLKKKKQLHRLHALLV